MIKIVVRYFNHKIQAWNEVEIIFHDMLKQKVFT